MNYKGDIKNFPKEVVEKILERQEEQCNPRNVTVFENDIGAGRSCGGFIWNITTEGKDFWYSVLIDENFDLFFEKYPKNPQYPKVMLVSEWGDTWIQRVVFMEKNGRYLAWISVSTLEESERVVDTVDWRYAKDIEEDIVEYTLDDIAKALNTTVDKIRIKK